MSNQSESLHKLWWEGTQLGIPTGQQLLASHLLLQFCLSLIVSVLLPHLSRPCSDVLLFQEVGVKYANNIICTHVHACYTQHPCCVKAHFVFHSQSKYLGEPLQANPTHIKNANREPLRWSLRTRSCLHTSMSFPHPYSMTVLTSHKVLVTNDSV